MSELKLPKFVKLISPLTSETHKGALLNICGTEYKAWEFDPFIYEAIGLSAATFKDKELSYESVLHLRYWLRENYQHGHNVDFENCLSMRDVKDNIDKVINLEFFDYDGEGTLKEQKENALKANEKLLSTPKHDKVKKNSNSIGI